MFSNAVTSSGAAAMRRVLAVSSFIERPPFTATAICLPVLAFTMIQVKQALVAAEEKT